jgi:hypothetical protein
VNRGKFLFVVAAALLGSVGCEVVTNQEVYAPLEPGIVTFLNSWEAPAYLSACEPFHLEELVAGQWEDRGTVEECLDPAARLLVKGGEAVELPFDAPGEAGVWRLSFTIGLGCTEQANGGIDCGARWRTATAPFDVLECDPIETGCPDAVDAERNALKRQVIEGNGMTAVVDPALLP